MIKKNLLVKNIDIILMLFIFLVLFFLPILFTGDNTGVDWKSVLKIWQDQILLLPLFALNHWVLVPKLMLQKKYLSYVTIVMVLITIVTIGYYAYDVQDRKKGLAYKQQNTSQYREYNRVNEPKPIPPYAELLFLSLVIIAVDTGFSFTKHWHNNEEDKVMLERETVKAQLGMLRNQISPHFFMNTLNNIYALIEGDKQQSRRAVMKLSKLMRYLLYENQNGKVLLSKEFEFTQSYVDLMKLRFVNNVEIKLNTPIDYNDVEIPVMLFVSYLENAFKYGTSYEYKSFIDASFEIKNDYLVFTCTNSSNNNGKSTNETGGIGLKNSKQRLDLLYKNHYKLKIHNVKDLFSVELKIPLT